MDFDLIFTKPWNIVEVLVYDCSARNRICIGSPQQCGEVQVAFAIICKYLGINTGVIYVCVPTKYFVRK